MALPIEISSLSPLKFRWVGHVETPVGARTMEHEGSFSPAFDGALKELIETCQFLVEKDIELRSDITELRSEVNKLRGQLAAKNVKKGKP